MSQGHLLDNTCTLRRESGFGLAGRHLYMIGLHKLMIGRLTYIVGPNTFMIGCLTYVIGWHTYMIGQPT
jgi:hypothetical protein